MNKIKVYVVVRLFDDGFLPEAQVSKIFTDKTKAEEYMNIEQKNNGQYDYFIVEKTVDE